MFLNPRKEFRKHKALARLVPPVRRKIPANLLGNGVRPMPSSFGKPHAIKTVSCHHKVPQAFPVLEC